MGILTHKFGMILDITEPLGSGNREHIERGIEGITGVSSADFIQSRENMVVVEYDPYVTSPGVLHQKIREIKQATVLGTFNVSRPPDDEDFKTS